METQLSHKVLNNIHKQHFYLYIYNGKGGGKSIIMYIRATTYNELSLFISFACFFCSQCNQLISWHTSQHNITSSSCRAEFHTHAV